METKYFDEERLGHGRLVEGIWGDEPLSAKEWGGKGAGLREASLVLGREAVPPGMVISGTVGASMRGGWRHDKSEWPVGLEEAVQKQMAMVEEHASELFGVPMRFGGREGTIPLTVAVRSGARHSMAGKLDTVVNVGLNDDTVTRLGDVVGAECAWGCYLDFCLAYLRRQYGVSREDVERAYAVSSRHRAWRKQFVDLGGGGDLAGLYRDEIAFVREWEDPGLREKYGLNRVVIPQDPREQLRWAIENVWRSWAVSGGYRMQKGWGLDATECTSVVIQSMVIANRPEAGAGVAFSGDPLTGEDIVVVDALPGKMGKDVVDGKQPVGDFGKEPPEVTAEITQLVQRMAKHAGRPQDMEFAWCPGLDGKPKVFVLQVRSAPLSSQAWLEVVGKVFKRGLMTESEVMARVPQAVIAGLVPGVRADAEKKAQLAAKQLAESLALGRQCLLLSGGATGGGVGKGILVTSYAEAQEMAAQGIPVVLMVKSLPPRKDIGFVEAIVIGDGMPTGHLGVLAISQGIPGAIGCATLKWNGDNQPMLIDSEGALVPAPVGNMVTLDGKSGQLFLGSLPVARSVKLNAWQQAVVDVRRRMAGGESMYADAALSGGFWERFRLMHEWAERADAVARERWRSLKAQSQEVLMAVFPEAMRSHFTVVPIDKEAPEKSVGSIEQLVHEGWAQGFGVVVRSAYQNPEYATNPTIFFPPGSEEKLQRFLRLHDSSVSDKHGCLKDWRERADLAEVLVGWIHPETLLAEKQDDFFMWMLRMPQSPEAEVSCQINLGTADSRSFETVGPDSLFELRMKVGEQFDGGRGAVLFRVGREHIRENWVDEVVRLVCNYGEVRASEEVEHVWYQLRERLGERVDERSPEWYAAAREALIRMAGEGLLPKSILEKLVDAREWAVALKVANWVFEEHWQDIACGMGAIENVFAGGSEFVLEGEGRMQVWEEQAVGIYGIKGLEERLKVFGAARLRQHKSESAA